jgi:hypothetical protein
MDSIKILELVSPVNLVTHSMETFVSLLLLALVLIVQAAQLAPLITSYGMDCAYCITPSTSIAQFSMEMPAQLA